MDERGENNHEEADSDRIHCPNPEHRRCVAPVAAASHTPQPIVLTAEEPTPDEAKKIFIGGLSATGDSGSGDSVATGRDDVITREDKDRG